MTRGKSLGKVPGTQSTLVAVRSGVLRLGGSSESRWGACRNTDSGAFPPLGVSDSKGSLGICIVNEFSGPADAGGRGHSIWEPLSWASLLLVSSSLSGGSAVTSGALEWPFPLTQASVSSSPPPSGISFDSGFSVLVIGALSPAFC